MNGWNSNSPLRQAHALWDMINFTNNVKDEKGNLLVKGKQKGQVLNVSNALNYVSQQRTDIANTNIKRKSLEIAQSNEQQRKIVETSNKVNQVGGIYKNRRDMIAIKRLNEFKQPKFKKEALSNFNKNEFKTVVEDFIIYDRPTEAVIIRDGSDYYGAYANVKDAMDMIYTQLSHNYERGDIFAKKLGVINHGKYSKQAVFKPSLRKGKR